MPESTPRIYNHQEELTLVETMPNLDYERLMEEEAQRQAVSQGPAQFGFLHEVNYSLENSGKWTTLDNGNRIWQL